MDKPVDTVQTPAPQSEPQADVGLKFEIVDTPEGTPEGGGAAVSAQPQPQERLIAGKYRTIEEAEKGLTEAQRAMHEAREKAAAYEKMLVERANQPIPSQHSSPPDMDESIREKLADKPASTIFQMINDVWEYKWQQQQAQQRQVMTRFQQFAGQPGFADVANEVAQQLPFATEPIDPVEGTFLRARIAKLEQMLTRGNGAAPQAPLHVESGSGARPGANTMRVELEQADRARRIFGDRTEELAKRAAKLKTTLGGRTSMSIDEYEGLNNA